MAIITQGQMTVVDITDSRQLFARLGCNIQPVQIYDPNTGKYNPNWVSTPPSITPIIYINQTPLSLNETGLTIAWKRREGTASETALTANEVVSGNILKVNANKLSNVSSKMLTYIAYISYLDPETSNVVNATTEFTFTLLQTGEDAKLVSISGEQVFKYDKNGNISGATQISLSATATNVNISKWQYKNADGAFVDYPTTSDNTSITSSTLVVKPSHAVFFNNVATIKIATSDANVYDIITITKLYDGATGGTGANAINVILSNEAQILSANKDGLCVASKIISKVTAYSGTTQVIPTVATPTGLPSGMTFAKTTSGNEVTVTLTITANATLGGVDNGVVNLDVTASGKTFDKVISWAKSKIGGTGSAGANAINFLTYAPNGTVVHNQEGNLTLKAVGYNGPTEIMSGATYQWAKLKNGTYENISGATSSTLTVRGIDIINIETFRCIMTYASKAYTSTITVEDKGDVYFCTYESSGGDKATNGKYESIIICKVWRSGKEVDELLTGSIGTTAPSAPKSGDLWYKVDKTAKTVVLQKYNGSAWVVATEKQQFTYTWYRIDKNGNPIDTTTPFKTGKVIFANQSDIDKKTTFKFSVDDGK